MTTAGGTAFTSPLSQRGCCWQTNWSGEWVLLAITANWTSRNIEGSSSAPKAWTCAFRRPMAPPSTNESSSHNTELGLLIRDSILPGLNPRLSVLIHPIICSAQWFRTSSVSLELADTVIIGETAPLSISLQRPSTKAVSVPKQDWTQTEMSR